MVTIEIRECNKLHTISGKSAFVSFPFDASLVAYTKSMSNRVYISESKEWEIPESLVAKYINDLPNESIQLIGEVSKNEETVYAEIPSTYKFKTTPFKHQLDALKYGLSTPRFILGDDQGLGKTKQAIDLACIRKSEGIKHCLIICGVNSLKYNWREEIKTHSNESSWVLGTRYTKRAPVKEYEGSGQDKLDDLKNLPDSYFLITNIETIRALSYIKPGAKKKKLFPIAEQIQTLCNKGEIGMIIFDECHKCKNPTSQQGQALINISARYMLAMSGTPLMNSPLDMYFPLRWLGYEEHSLFQFKQHYCNLGGYGGTEVIGYKNLGQLREMISQVMLRRTKDEVLDLPEKIHTYEYVEMSKDQKKIYDEVRTAIRKDINKIRLYADPLAQLIRLRQATGYPGILSSNITESSKMDRMVELVDEILASDNKVIIFSNWSQMTEVARHKLTKYKPCYITGETTATERMNEVNAFQNSTDRNVIIGTIGAMGTGLTLNKASYVIFLDSPWNRANKDQAEDRAHRIGTRGVVNVITLVCKDTIDERIEELVYKKGKMSDLLVDGKIPQQNTSQILDYMLG